MGTEFDRFRWVNPTPISNEIPNFQQSLAVVIGINDYGHGIPPLRTAVNDASALAELLQRRHNYTVCRLVETVTRARLQQLLAEELPRVVGPQDRLLFYFAGHGIALNGEDGPRGFLIPQDACAEDRATFLPMQDLHAALCALPCRHLLAILDCCFAGAFRWESLRNVRPLPAGALCKERYTHFLTSPAWQAITSAAHDQWALDIVTGSVLSDHGLTERDGAAHSPFAAALLDALDGAADLTPPQHPDGVITAGELQLYLRMCVEPSTEYEQTPQLWPLRKHDRGEFIFLTPAVTPALSDAEPLTHERNPWQGLHPYQEQDAEIFFGRRQITETLHELVRVEPLVVVEGGSGTGKSSLVQAGLLPRLRKEQSASGACEWRILPPMRPGSSPLRKLAHLMQQEFSIEAGPGADGEPVCAWCAGAVDQWLREHPSTKLLLVLDQFEELITYGHDNEERAQFLRLLETICATAQNRFHIVVTLRSDFTPHFRDTPLAQRWARGRLIVPPLSQDELRTVIEEPASRRELYFESSALVDTLVNEVVQTPGALPLLSFSLSELYHAYLARQEIAQQTGEVLDRALTLADYQKLGGVAGSLSKRATAVYEGFDPLHQATLRRVMLRMVATEGGELARRRAPCWELEYDDPAEVLRVQAVLKALTDARLIVQDVAREQDQPFVEPAHDALVLAWDRLIQWKNEAGDGLSLQRRLSQAAYEWTQADKRAKPGFLWHSDPRLPQVHQLLAPDDFGRRGPAFLGAQVRRNFFPRIRPLACANWFNRHEIAFARASIRRRAATLRQIVGMTIAVMLMLASAAFIAWTQWQSAAERLAQAQTAESRRLAGDAIQQLSSDPGASLVMALAALPWREARPYVPEAESALGQALRVYQERGYLSAMLTEPAQVAMGSSAIAIGGDSLRLTDFQLSNTVTLHDGAIDGVAWGAGERLLAFGGGALYVWQGEKPVAAPALPWGNEGQIRCAEWRPHHNQIGVCVGSQDNHAVWLWDLEQTGDKAWRLLIPDIDLGAEIATHGLAWSPDGYWLAAWGAMPYLWGSQMAGAIALPGEMNQHVQWLAWSPNNDYLLGAWHDAAWAYIWPVDSPQAAVKLTTNTMAESGRFWWHEGDGQLTALVGGRDGSVRRFAPDGVLLETIDSPVGGGAVRGLTLNEKASRLLVSLDSGAAFLWSPGDRYAQPLAVQHDGAIYDAAWRGRYVATVGADRVAHVWDGDEGALVTTLAGHTHRLIGVAWLASGDMLTFDQADLALPSAGSVRRWEVLSEEGRPVCRQAATAPYPECLFFSEPLPIQDEALAEGEFHWFDDRSLWLLTPDGAGRRWRLNETGELEPTPTLTLPWVVDPALSPTVAWSPAGEYALVYGDFGAQLWQTAELDWRLVATFTESVYGAQWLDGGVVIASQTGVWWWRPDDGNRRLLEGAEGLIFAQGAAEIRIAVVDNDDDIFVWSISATATTRLLYKERMTLAASLGIPELDRAITSLDMSVDGRYLLVVLDNQAVVVWAIDGEQQQWLWPYPTVEALASAPAHFHPAQPLVATLQGKRLYVLALQPGGDMTVVWQSPASSADLAGLTWDRSGKHLLTWGNDGYAHLWRWDDESQIASEIMRLPHNDSQGRPPLLDDRVAHLLTIDEAGWGIRLWTIWPGWEALARAALERCTHCD